MLWDYDFRLIPRFPRTEMVRRNVVAAPMMQASLDSWRKSSKHLRERKDTSMRACEFDIAAFALPAAQLGQRGCFSAFFKTMAKTTTKTV